MKKKLNTSRKVNTNLISSVTNCKKHNNKENGTTCKHYDNCSAQLCPNDADSLKNCSWFSGEEICKLRSVPDWVKRQRRIEKMIGDNPEAGYFKHSMLAVPLTIRQGIRGINPDALDAEKEIRRWLSNRSFKRCRKSR